MTTATKAPPTDTGRCGQAAGYGRHYRAGEDPCDPCLRAKRAADKRRRPPIRLRPTDAPAKPLSDGSWFGLYAGRDVQHAFRSMGTQCVACWGFPDDPRHPVVVR